ncbi:hypothetical protein [Streptomyces boninensis]|uniref:hypothetical protein n=1 Tax=Streptomyces boninensis TaxID=2039455 RepID=UPI003B2105F6
MQPDLGPLTVQRLTGQEPLHAGEHRHGTVADFWRWACSDLASNTMRGILAEYLVAHALDAATGTRQEWDVVDIRSPEGWRVEVQSSAYLQTWAQSKPSSIGFSIAPASGWDAQTGNYSPEQLRRSDVYVFCVLNHQDKQSLNPLDLAQWDFYVLATRVLDESCPRQRTISLSSLQRLAPIRTGYAGLRQAVASCAPDPAETAPAESASRLGEIPAPPAPRPRSAGR